MRACLNLIVVPQVFGLFFFVSAVSRYCVLAPMVLVYDWKAIILYLCGGMLGDWKAGKRNQPVQSWNRQTGS